MLKRKHFHAPIHIPYIQSFPSLFHFSKLLHPNPNAKSLIRVLNQGLIQALPWFVVFPAVPAVLAPKNKPDLLVLSLYIDVIPI